MKEKLSTSGKGFHMTFENGLTISVQWGYANYCDTGETAEIAIWNAEGKWVNFEHDQAKGWLSPDTIADYICKVKNAISIDELHEGKGLILE